MSGWLLPSTFSLFLQDSAQHGLFPFTVTTKSQQQQSGMDWNDPQGTQHSALSGSPFTKLGQARTISQGATQTSITGHPRYIFVDWDRIYFLSVIFSSRYRFVYMLHYNHQHSWAVMPIHSQAVTNPPAVSFIFISTKAPTWLGEYILPCASTHASPFEALTILYETFFLQCK